MSISHVDPKNGSETPEEPQEPRFRLPPGILPSTDLTEFARSGEMPPSVMPRQADGAPWPNGLPPLVLMMARGLFRYERRHVLVTGQRGVGKKSLVCDVARRAASGEFPFLRDSQFLLVYAGDVAPHESRARFAALVAVLNEQSFFPDSLLGAAGEAGCWSARDMVDRPYSGNLVLCINGLGTLLRGEGGTTNTPVLRTLLRRYQMRIVGIMSQRDFDELLASEPEILEMCTRVEVPEPDEATALEIVRQKAPASESEFNCRVTPEALERLVTLSAKFIWNRCLPTKAIKILERVCEDAAFERLEFGKARSVDGSLRDPRVSSELNSGEPRRTDGPHPGPLPGGEGDTFGTPRRTNGPHPGPLPGGEGDTFGTPRISSQLNSSEPRRTNAALGEAGLHSEMDRRIGEPRRTDAALGEAGLHYAPADDDETVIGVEHVIRAISEISGVPVETLSGDIDDTDYEQILGAAVVGQDEAVRAVATELRLIKAGITDPGKPASVMLFCGLNGVGKTELAKKLAEIYSASKRLQVYTMGNFIESHSVSGIIGVPAGYVGHDQGGRLINDLNADPYGVFLLDEIEKSHPDVLKPFLNLFDEGWIVDQRGVKAYADRAIFILTSNAGYEAISQMHQDKRPMEEIVEHAKSTLARVRNDRSGQPVLSQAFLARIKRILVFNPLNEEAMAGITRLLVQQVQKTWRQHRGKTIEVPEELVTQIARQGCSINDKSGGREGGRGIRRLIADQIEDRIQRAAVRSKPDYTRCRTIRLSLGEAHAPAVGGPPNGHPDVAVTFE